VVRLKSRLISVAFDLWLEQMVEIRRILEEVRSGPRSQYVTKKTQTVITEEMRLLRISQKIARRWYALTMLPPFSQLVENAQKGAATRMHLRGLVQRLSNIRLCAAYDTLVSNITALKRHRVVFSRMASRMKHRRVFKAFQTWQHDARARAGLRRAARKVLLRWTHLRLSVVFVKWMEHTDHSCAVKEESRKCDEIGVSQTLRRSAPVDNRPWMPASSIYSEQSGAELLVALADSLSPDKASDTRDLRSAWAAGMSPHQVDAGLRDRLVVAEASAARASAGSVAGAQASKDRRQLSDKTKSVNFLVFPVHVCLLFLTVCTGMIHSQHTHTHTHTHTQQFLSLIPCL